MGDFRSATIFFWMNVMNGFSFNASSEKECNRFERELNEMKKNMQEKLLKEPEAFLQKYDDFGLGGKTCDNVNPSEELPPAQQG